jgi:nucleotide-binding universal stress UspA family protein
MEAEEYDGVLATAYRASVDVFHVLELYPGLDPEYPINQIYLDQLRRDTDTQLAGAVRRFQGKQVKATGRHVLGVPSLQICAAAVESQAGLIVMGTRGKMGFEHVLLGSTAERVVVRAPCPVLTVCRSGSPTTEPPFGFQHILAPVDFSDCSLDALEYAVQVAKQFNATVTILHVLEPVCYGLDLTLVHASEREQIRTRIEMELSALAQAIRLEGIIVHHAVRGGTPADSLLRTMSETPCDLVVMGTHGRRGLSHLVNGSVAEAVLRRAPCPVLTVKSPKFAPGHRRIVSKALSNDI